MAVDDKPPRVKHCGEKNGQYNFSRPMGHFAHTTPGIFNSGQKSYRFAAQNAIVWEGWPSVIQSWRRGGCCPGLHGVRAVSQQQQQGDQGPASCCCWLQLAGAICLCSFAS